MTSPFDKARDDASTDYMHEVYSETQLFYYLDGLEIFNAGAEWAKEYFETEIDEINHINDSLHESDRLAREELIALKEMCEKLAEALWWYSKFGEGMAYCSCGNQMPVMASGKQALTAITDYEQFKKKYTNP